MVGAAVVVTIVMSQKRRRRAMLRKMGPETVFAAGAGKRQRQRHTR